MAYLSVSRGGSTYRGTASAFASNAVITAAHVVYDTATSTQASSYSLSFARNDSTYPYTTITATPTMIFIPVDYKTTGSTEYDFAILVYGSTVSGYVFGFSTSGSAGTSITIGGYPKDASTAGGSTNEYRQWTSSGTVSSSTTSIIYYNIDTTGGQSGSPVYNTSNQIVGIHHGGNTTTNSAKKIDSALYNLMYSIRYPVSA